MNIFLIKDYYRIDGITGEPVEKGYDQDFVKYDSEIYLESARNQYVSFQIVIDSMGKKVDGIDVEFFDLTGAASISKNEYSAYIEWFHMIDGKCVPDALFPLNETELEFKIPLHEGYLKEQRAGALWIDLFIPRETEAGEYFGKLGVKSGNYQKDFGIRLKVYDVTLPDRSSITADLNNYADSISPAFPHLRNNKNRYEDGSFFDVEKEFVRMAREHRCVFHNLGYRHSGHVVPSFAPELEGQGKNIRVKSWELFDRHFGPYLDGSAFKGSRRGEFPIEFLYMPFNLNWPASYEKWGQKGYTTEYRRILAEFIRHFEEKGWTQTYLEIFLNHKKIYRFFPYTVDEIWYEHDEEVVDQFYEIIKGAYEHTNVKFILRMDSSNHYGNHFDSKYSDWFKFWVGGYDMVSWFPESIPVMKSKGNILWIYGGDFLGHMDKPLHGLFTNAARCFMMRVDGFCLWNCTNFGRDYLVTPHDNGAEAIMYPGVEFGLNKPVPSIRLKALRNHMQIADLMMLSEGWEYECRPVRRQMERIVNRHYGFEDTSCWWKEKPPFINTPPRYWDFGEKFAQYCLRPQYIDRSPKIIEDINRDVLKLLSEVNV